MKPLILNLNRKYIIYIAILFLFRTSLLSQNEYGSRRVNTVVIDPGHGGRDPGAIGRFSKEKEIALAISLKLGRMINQRFPEVKVIYTRNDDNFVELYQRAEIANKAKADMFISIHANSTNKPGPSGVEFWVLGLHKADENLEVVKKENAALQFEQDVRKNYGFDPNSPEGAIIMTMKQNQYLDQSIQFAKLLESRFVREDNQLNRGSKQAGFIVLFKTSMPSVLVEVGFISNPDEEQYIGNETGQTRIAANLANAFADYKLKYESGAIKQVISESMIKPAPSASMEVSSQNHSGFTNSSSFIGSSIENEDVKNSEELLGKETARVASSKPTADKAELSIEKKKVIVEDDADKRSAPKLVNIENVAEAARKKPTTSPDIITSMKTSSGKQSSKSLEMPKNTKKIVTEDEAMVRDMLSKNSSSEADKTAMKSNEVSKPTPKINTSTPGKIKIEDPGSKLPSYMADKEIKKEIVDNTKKINLQDNIIQNNDISVPPAKQSSIPAVNDKNKNGLTANSIKKITSNDGVIYKIQVKAASNKMRNGDPITSQVKDIEESFENNMYKYLVGNFVNEKDAQIRLSNIKAQGIKDAFIVKYKDGVRVK